MPPVSHIPKLTGLTHDHQPRMLRSLDDNISCLPRSDEARTSAGFCCLLCDHDDHCTAPTGQYDLYPPSRSEGSPRVA